MRISDWSSDVCSSDLRSQAKQNRESIAENEKRKIKAQMFAGTTQRVQQLGSDAASAVGLICAALQEIKIEKGAADIEQSWNLGRSEEHTSELQSLMRISYAVFCLQKKTKEEKEG